MDISGYQVFLGAVMLLWPLAIVGLLYLMSKLEGYVNRLDADTPEEAGLGPSSTDKEVKIVFGGKVVGESDG
jgi:hypothetical protein